MKGVLVFRYLGCAAAILLLALTGQAEATTLLRLDSDPGQFQLQGHSVTYGDTHYSFTTSSSEVGKATIEIGTFSLRITSNAAVSPMPPFAVGKYYFHSPSAGTLFAPGISVVTTPGGGGCLGDSGMFVIRDIGYSDPAQTLINKLALDFIFFCDFQPQQLRGYLRYNTTVPLIVDAPTSFPIISDNFPVATETMTLYGNYWLPGSMPVSNVTWRQTQGKAVDMSQSESGIASFVAPNVHSGGAQYSFRLKVTNEAGLSDSDDVPVYVAANGDVQSGVRIVGAQDMMGFAGPGFEDWSTKGNATFTASLYSSQIDFQLGDGFPTVLNAYWTPGQWYVTPLLASAKVEDNKPSLAQLGDDLNIATSIDASLGSEACNIGEGLYYVADAGYDAVSGDPHFAVNVIYMCHDVESFDSQGNPIYKYTNPLFQEIRYNSDVPYQSPSIPDISVQLLEGESTDIQVPYSGTGKNALFPTLTYLINSPEHGQVSIDRSTGAMKYSPEDSYAGKDHFSFVVPNAMGYVSNIVTVDVDVVSPTPPTGGGSGSGGSGGGSSSGGGGTLDWEILLILAATIASRHKPAGARRDI
jgi:hypothetical protein